MMCVLPGICPWPVRLISLEAEPAGAVTSLFAEETVTENPAFHSESNLMLAHEHRLRLGKFVIDWF